jgi:hypothetical protein
LWAFPEAVFIITATNKVYGNRLSLIEMKSRWEVAAATFFSKHGIDESMGVDSCAHSLFG